MNKYCLPIRENSKEKVLAQIEQHKDEFGFIEVWLDYLDQGAQDLVETVGTELGSKVIFLFRRNELEEIEMSLSERKTAIDKISINNNWLDLDVTTQSDELSYVAQLKSEINLICSYHNYRRTPPVKDLEQLVVRMESCKADIYKFACLCHDVKDALILMEIGRQLSEAGKRCIVLGMGEFGLITRVFGTLYWNEMIFAPLTPQDATAPGQITRNDLEQILMRLTFGSVENAR